MGGTRWMKGPRPRRAPSSPRAARSPQPRGAGARRSRWSAGRSGRSVSRPTSPSGASTPDSCSIGPRRRDSGWTFPQGTRFAGLRARRRRSPWSLSRRGARPVPGRSAMAELCRAVDPVLGVRKTTIGIKEGRIVGIGRAGNPDVTDGVDLTIGPNTLPVMGYGLIATPGAIDSHVHLITPALVAPALSAGVTTLITAGFEEPPANMTRLYEAFEAIPVNLGLQASARSEVAAATERVIEAGAVGLKIHEDWGAYPEIIDATLRLADAHDIAVCLHTDGLNESCELEDTVDAIGGRAVHAYHVEGAGGGHVPDAIGLVREPNVVCSSTTPTIPYGRATAAEHPAMILAVHGGSPDLPEDVEA